MVGVYGRMSSLSKKIGTWNKGLEYWNDEKSSSNGLVFRVFSLFLLLNNNTNILYIYIYSNIPINI